MFDGFKIVFVEDDAAVRASLAQTLELAGFEVVALDAAERALDLLVPGFPGIVVSDVRLSGMDGLALLGRVRAMDADIPVILVTARGEAADRIAGLEADADDYVAKPYHPRELALRAQRLVRRTETVVSARTARGILSLDTTNHGAVLGSQTISLTVNEFKLLSALVSRPDVVLDFAQLLLLGWGESERLGSREMIKAAIYRLRHKLEAAVPGSSAAIEAVRGAGYLLRTV